MPSKSSRKSDRSPKREPRVADEIMAGMRELERMMDRGKKPGELFTVKTVEIPEPNPYSAKQVLALRKSLNVSQALFAHLLGVSPVLVKSWEGGVRRPSPMARRLFDTIRANPAEWLANVRRASAA